MQLQFSGSGTLQNYKRLRYEYAHALAEFIDNSTHAASTHIKKLKEKDKNYKLKVDITFEPRGGIDGKGIFEIQDNACGMTEECLKNALIIGRRPSIIGRSRYGMGMKTAAIWMGNRITIKTKPLGESFEYEVVIDLTKIISSDNFVLPFRKIEKKDLNLSYTIIRIEHLDQIPAGRAIGSIKEQLKSIYRHDTREKILTLSWNGEEIAWDDTAWKFLPSEDQTGVYKKEFNFEITRSDGDTKKVWGWVGILLDGKRTRAGFSTLCNDRVIIGYPDAWRPESIFGDYGSNDLVNQRITGEIHLDNFEVTHTKDAVKWQLNEYHLVTEKLKDVCATYRNKAQEYRKRKGSGPTEQQKQIVTDEIKKEAESAVLSDAITTKFDFVNPNLIDAATAAATKKISETQEPKFIIKYRNNLTVKLFTHQGEITGSYLQISTHEDDSVSILVNESHPAFPNGESDEELKAWYRMCLYDGIAECQCQKMIGEIRPNTIREIKDQIYKALVQVKDTN